MNIGIVIPAFDEEETIGAVVERCRMEGMRYGSTRVVVCDNGSHDGTSRAAVRSGAEVVSAMPRGYGTACLAAITHLRGWPDVIVFVDADGSSRPEELGQLLDPILGNRADLVIGVRSRSAPMTLPQRWGNRLATRLIAWRWGRRFADLGPFRAISRPAYQNLGMRDRTWGWTIEMQILALLQGL